ncbi:MAG: hypothetical protein KDB26_04790 [Microthrixaceae bacterium]|nr:hypothetical protein [Microthrixaceae bacterium]
MSTKIRTVGAGDEQGTLGTRGQGGYALTLTLILILLTTLIFGALFGLLGVTVRTTKMSEVTAREAAAADAAVEAAIVAMREDPDSCARSSQTVLTDKNFDQGTPQSTDDVVVSVDCEPVGGSASSVDQVRIVGADGYQGSVKWNTDCSGAAVPPTCTPWTKLLGASPFNLNSSKPGLVHTGPESLRFASGVTVRTGAAALGSASGGVGPAKPALTVTGQYAQGSTGLTMASGDDPGANKCGILGTVDAVSYILDNDGAPDCDNSEAQAVDSDPTAIEAESGLVAPATKPAIPATCGLGPVMTFVPGTYDATMVASLNTLLDGSKVACRGKTFWFSPGSSTGGGIYSFDGPTINFSDPTSTYVFGAPAGWNPATSGVPSVLSDDASAPLCSQLTAGSTVVISARTAIRHSAGRVAVCPAFAPSGKPYPALYQMTSVPSSVKLVGTPALPRALVYACDPTWDYIVWGVSCTSIRNFNFTVQGEGSEKIDSLRVLLTGTEGWMTQNNFVDARTVTLRVGSPPSLACSSAPVTGTPNGGFTLAFEMLTGTCATVLKGKTPADLNGANIYASVQLRLRQLVLIPWLFAQQTFTLTEASTQMNGLLGTAPSSAFSAPATDWTSPSKAAVSDGDSAQPQMSCEQMICQMPLATRTRNPLVANNTREFAMEVNGGFNFAGLSKFTDAGIKPRISALRVDVDITTAQKPIPSILGIDLDPKNFRSDMNVSLELETPSGNRCVLHKGGVNGGDAGEVQRLSFSVDTADDLADGGSCNHSIRAFDELTDPATKLKVIVEMPCVRNPDPGASWLCFQELFQDDHVWGVRPPGIDRIAVYASTDSYLGAPSNSQIAIDAAAPAPRKMFRSFGQAWLPLTDLDIHWQGDGGTATLFSNDLVLHGLGSDMTSGATTAFVCCGKPDTREVRLRARIDGRSRLVATVRYTDVTDEPTPVYKPGSAVNVLDWRRGRLSGG